MSHLYIQLYDVDSDSSVNSQELEMTSLQDGGPRESQPSTQMHEMVSLFHTLDSLPLRIGFSLSFESTVFKFYSGWSYLI